MLALRVQMAQNAGFSDYRAYRWQQLHRFDYTPADNETFHRAIEEKVVPVATRIYEKRARAIGVDTLRPSGTSTSNRACTSSNSPRSPLSPMLPRWNPKCATIFHKVDPQLGAYYVEMQEKGMLNLDNRKGKGPGAFCTYYPITDSPFIFGNAVGMHDDVQMLLHEAGHAFHGFETRCLPSCPRFTGMEFAEVASMGMELLAAPYLTADEQGGFYTRKTPPAPASNT